MSARIALRLNSKTSLCCAKRVKRCLQAKGDFAPSVLALFGQQSVSDQRDSGMMERNNLIGRLFNNRRPTGNLSLALY